MKSLWVTPNESQRDERGAPVVAGDEADEEEEEEVTKVITYLEFLHHLPLTLSYLLQMYLYILCY